MLLKFLIKNLLIIHKGTIIAKTKATFSLSIAISPIGFVVEKLSGWYSINYGYVSFVLVAVFFDHFLGSYVHAFIKRDFTLKKNIKGFFIKCSMILVVGILVEGFKYVMGGSSIITDYFGIVSRLMVFLYPAGSALMNCAVITDGSFPPTAWMDKLKNFNKDMNIKNFKDNEGASN